MREAYPEVDAARTTIHDVLGAEEERFAKTLSRGLRLFDELAAAGNISGEDAFRLHDTYGFPLELTVELAEERGLAVDVDGFRALMEEQRERSRTARPDRGRARGRVRPRRRLPHRVRRVREDRGADADRRARGPAATGRSS